MNDDDVLSLLAESLADDQPPAVAVEGAYAAYGWRNLDAELARLIEDSQVEVVGFRDAAYSRVVSYETEHGTVELSVDHQIFSITVSPQPQKLVLRQLSGGRQLAVDDAGRASASDVHGPTRFEITWAGGSALTPWVTL
jgi:hypothetical protein